MTLVHLSKRQIFFGPPTWPCHLTTPKWSFLWRGSGPDQHMEQGNSGVGGPSLSLGEEREELGREGWIKAGKGGWYWQQQHCQYPIPLLGPDPHSWICSDLWVSDKKTHTFPSSGPIRERDSDELHMGNWRPWTGGYYGSRAQVSYSLPQSHALQVERSTDHWAWVPSLQLSRFYIQNYCRWLSLTFPLCFPWTFPKSKPPFSWIIYSPVKEWPVYFGIRIMITWVVI